jgi:2-dehydro-3-deoxygluconokinase
VIKSQEEIIMASANIDIVCMGEAMVEFTRMNRSKSEALYIRGLGGDTSNCAISAARQGVKVAYLSAVGDDQFGKIAIDTWLTEGIDVSQVFVDPNSPTGIYFIDPVPKGRNFTYYRAGSAASRMSSISSSQTILSRTAILHLSAITQAISIAPNEPSFEAIDIVKKNGGRISYDTNLRLNLWGLEEARRVINKTLTQADILLPSLDEAQILTGLDNKEDILNFYLQFEPEILALKCGSEGAIVIFEGRKEYIPALNVNAIDTSGAGDTFAGAFLAQIIQGESPFEAARFAVVASGISVQGYGAMAPIPNRKQVLRAMAR